MPVVFLPLFALAIVLSSRKVDLNQPMFEDVPREHPHVYRRVIGDVWRSALCMGGLGLCTGIMRAAAITDPAVGSVVNIISMGASLVAAVTLVVLSVLLTLISGLIPASSAAKIPDYRLKNS